MPNPTNTAHVAPKSEIGKRDSQLASNLGTEGTTPQTPTYRAHTGTTGNLRQYARDMAYIETPNRIEATRTFKKRI